MHTRCSHGRARTIGTMWIEIALFVSIVGGTMTLIIAFHLNKDISEEAQRIDSLVQSAHAHLAAVTTQMASSTAAAADELTSDESSSEHSWNARFLPLYAGLIMYAIYVAAQLIFWWRQLRNATAARASEEWAHDDGLDDNDALPGQEDDNGDSTTAQRIKPAAMIKIARVQLVDGVLDAIWIVSAVVLVALLAARLDTDDDEHASWVPFFILLLFSLLVYTALLVLGALQTYAIERTPSNTFGLGALICGILTCWPDKYRAAMQHESKTAYDKNVQTAGARFYRYVRRPEFQYRPCAYCCTPWLLPGYDSYTLTVCVWLVPLALITSTILLWVHLTQLDAVESSDSDDRLALLMPRSHIEPMLSAVGALATSAAVSLWQPTAIGIDDLQLHHHTTTTTLNAVALARAAYRQNREHLATVAVAHHGRHHHQVTALFDEPDGVLSLAWVVAPLFIVNVLLLAQSMCLCVGCWYRARHTGEGSIGSEGVDTLLGSVYVVWLIALLVFDILLVTRNHDDDWHVTFAPLYIMFLWTLVIGGLTYVCCLPRSYRQRREYVSKWGIIIYRG